MTTKILFNTDEAAEMLGLSPVTLKEWRCVGKGPRPTHLGRAVRYHTMDLEAYARAMRDGTPYTWLEEAG